MMKHRFARKAAPFLAAACALALTACASSGAATAGSRSGTDAAGVRQAKSMVAEYEAVRPDSLDVPVLPGRPPAGKSVDFAACPLPVCAVILDAASQAARALGWHLSAFATPLTPAGYIQTWNEMLQGHPDYIMFTAITPDSVIAEQLREADARGIKMVNVAPENATDKPGPYGIISAVPNPGMFYENGVLGAAFALADAGGPISAVAADDPEYPGSQVPAAQGFVAELKHLCPPCHASTVDISLASPATTNDETIVNYVQRNPAVKFVFLNIDSEAQNLSQALASAGIHDVKVIVSQPSIADLQGVKDGQYAAAIQMENTTAGWRGIDALARASLGEPAGVETYPEGYHRIITSANVVLGVNPVTPGTPQAFLKAWHVAG
jgi:ABC-type sugar transport system substrate-binding protein